MSAAVRHVSRLDRPFAGIEQSLDEVRTEWVCVGGGLWFPIVRIRLCEGERGGRHAIDIALLCDPHTQTHTRKHTHTHTHIIRGKQSFPRTLFFLVDLWSLLFLIFAPPGADAGQPFPGPDSQRPVGRSFGPARLD